MLVQPVPCLQDNYAYLLLDKKEKKAAVIDPVKAENISAALQRDYPDYTLAAILTTHHHWDHAGGNNAVLNDHDIPCYGGSNQVEGVTHIVKDGENIKVGSLTINCLSTTGHTMDHVCYHVNDHGDQAVFTGDCVFSSGCGKIFEGTAENMWRALSKVMQLDNSTKVYFGHEYTVSNLKFAHHIEPGNADIQAKVDWAAKTPCTTPSTIENEKKTNPFFRVAEPAVRDRVKCHGSDEEVLAVLRNMKNTFGMKTAL